MNGRRNRKERGCIESAGILIGLALVVISIAAWFTHVFSCLAEEAWGFLIAGAIMFPIAIVHGIGIWFGFF